MFVESVSMLDLKRAQNKKEGRIVDIPRPFMKWAGGKRQLLDQIDPFLPAGLNMYIEPFVGGGALFFYLLPENAVLMDNNPVLINAYRVIKDHVDELIGLLRQHKNESDYYYRMRNADRLPEFKGWSDIERASRTIYMNRCCYNGLYRVNSKGQFNVPFGKYKNPNFCDEENLRAVSKALKNVEIINDSFERCLEFANEKTFIYLDPPYMPLSKTASFTGYTKEDFGEDDQIALFRVFRTLDERGCKIMLSNSYHKFILDLYRDYRIETLRARRSINSDASKRGSVREVLIMNDFRDKSLK